ncbi:MAG: hypothetical protein KKF48_02255 [Nanoarchaeota archaeon]|nr:hypothetical protein [Nanoarchaeota archaeon]MBU1027842.1 hypothetical protein [Nanoarchaeota archaeon]
MLGRKVKGNDEVGILEPIIERYVLRRPLKGDYAKEIHAEVKGRAQKDFRNFPMFNAHFEFNEKTGEINGINTGYGILLNEALTKDGFWLPTITQARKLDEAGLLSNGVWRQYGIAVYDGNNPNQGVADKLVKEASKRGWETPILAPFKALKIVKTGAKIGFGKDSEGIITGEEATEYLKKYFKYQGNSGALRLYRDTIGSWGANWNYLDDSDSNGRVDWICGEATQKNLEVAVLGSIDSVAKQEVAKINERLSSAKKAAFDILKQ